MKTQSLRGHFICAFFLCICMISDCLAQPGKVLSFQRLSYNVGNLKISPDSMRGLGWESCSLGDLDGDKRTDIFTTSPNGKGLGYLISLNSNGTVYKSRIIGRNRGLPDNATPTWLAFGSSCANIGDLNRDGITDLAIGNHGESGYAGDVCIIFLNADGSIKSFKLLAPGKNGFNATLGTKDHFGASVTSLGDIDNNRTTELVIGAPYTDDGNTQSGAIWILSIDSTGSCTDYKKISHATGGGNVLGLNQPYGRFGESAVRYMDIDGDNIPEFFVGRPYANYHSDQQGVCYAMSVKSDKTLKTFKRITDTSENFGDTLINPCFLSESIANLGDIDGNGFDDIVLGSTSNGLWGAYFGRGSARLLLMENNFRIKSGVNWDSLQNGIPAFEHELGFGLGLTGVGDINKDGRLDALAGMPLDYKQANLYGAMYVLFLDGKQYPVSVTQVSSPVVSVYPNPVSTGGNLQITLPGNLSGTSVILTARTVLGQEINLGELSVNGNSIYIDRVNLVPGLYMLSIKCNKQYFFCRKLIIE